MVIDWIFTDPHFYLTKLILAKHMLRNPYGPVHANQSAQSMQGQDYLLATPVLEVQEAISINKHFPEILLVVV